MAFVTKKSLCSKTESRFRSGGKDRRLDDQKCRLRWGDIDETVSSTPIFFTSVGVRLSGTGGR